MRILFFGDIVGEAGRDAIRLALPFLRDKYSPDFIIANAENATHGKGLSPAHHNLLISSGCDCLTLGNHWRTRQAIDSYIDDCLDTVRPLNVKGKAKGQGSLLFDVGGVVVRVSNVLGSMLMKDEVDSPFERFNSLLGEIKPSIHIVDFHAETTSEKAMFAHLFDGSVTAVLGTHTHVQTNDAKILKGGTGFISDAGMCGDPDGVIGFEKESVINRMVFGGEGHFELTKKPRLMYNAVILDVDEVDYSTKSIVAISGIIPEKRQ